MRYKVEVFNPDTQEFEYSDGYNDYNQAYNQFTDYKNKFRKDRDICLFANISGQILRLWEAKFQTEFESYENTTEYDYE